jgi:hypothetical protein
MDLSEGWGENEAFELCNNEVGERNKLSSIGEEDTPWGTKGGAFSWHFLVDLGMWFQSL